MLKPWTADGHFGAMMGVSWDYKPRRVEPCACGGVISADPEDWGMVAGAIRIHQATVRHQVYRHLMGYVDQVANA